MTEKKGALAPTKIDLPSYVTEFTDQDLRSGRLEDERDVLQPPRLKLINALSHEKKDFLVDKEGVWWSTGHQRVLGGVEEVNKDGIKSQKPVLIVPLDVKQEWIKFDDDLKLVWRTQDREGAQARAKDELWKYDILHVLVAAPIGDPLLEPQPMVLSFRTTSRKIGGNWYQQYTRMIRLPCFAQQWELLVARQSNDQGSWFVPLLGKMTPVPTREEMLKLKALHEAMVVLPWIPSMEDGTTNGHAASGASAPAADEGDEIPF